MDKKLIFDALAVAIASGGRKPPQDMMDRVHETIAQDYDVELLKKMDECFTKEAVDRNGVLSMGKVLSTACFFIAHTVYDACDTDNQICMMSQAYADYIHQTAHGLFRENGISKNKKKLG